MGSFSYVCFLISKKTKILNVTHAVKDVHEVVNLSANSKVTRMDNVSFSNGIRVNVIFTPERNHESVGIRLCDLVVLLVVAVLSSFTHDRSSVCVVAIPTMSISINAFSVDNAIQETVFLA